MIVECGPEDGKYKASVLPKACLVVAKGTYINANGQLVLQNVQLKLPKDTRNDLLALRAQRTDVHIPEWQLYSGAGTGGIDLLVIPLSFM